jgi:membrane associated rhomboid family serine protease
MPWQVLSYAFLHGDMMHLFFNMLGLWMFGSELERLWGHKRYLHFLLAGVLAAARRATAHHLHHRLAGAHRGRLGCAVRAAAGLRHAVPQPDHHAAVPADPDEGQDLRAGVRRLELLLGLMGPSGVAHFAHLGGMLGAWLMIRYWRGQPPFGPTRRR